MELKKKDEQARAIQDLIISSDAVFGDCKSIVEVPDIPIKHLFADQVYIRQMNMKQDQVVVGAIHNHLHIWFLMEGRVIINNNGDIVEHIAPCYTVSEPGSKRIIYAIEDSVFVNVHKNPSNTKNIKDLEKDIVSFSIEEYEQKNKII
jgi:hypothetical protein